MKRLITFLLFVTVFAALPAIADVTVGLPPDSGVGNCFPFSCSYSGEYQQVYTASQFSGPITITNLEFFNTQFNNGATSMNTGTWDISLSTTSADWNTLSSTFASNIGADNTLVFGGNLVQPWAFGDTLHINLSTPFTYNPGLGNLLMDVNVSGASAPGGNIFFDTNGFNGGADNGNTIVGRVYCPFGDCSMHSPVAESGYGLVTDFSTGTAVPEPSFVYVLGGALALLGVAQRVRRNRRADG